MMWGDTGVPVCGEVCAYVEGGVLPCAGAITSVTTGRCILQRSHESIWWSRQTESSPTEGVVMVTCLLVLLDVHCSLFSFTWLAARAKSGCGTNQ